MGAAKKRTNCRKGETKRNTEKVSFIIEKKLLITLISRYPYIKVTGCVSVYLFVPKDFANYSTDVVCSIVKLIMGSEKVYITSGKEKSPLIFFFLQIKSGGSFPPLSSFKFSTGL